MTLEEAIRRPDINVFDITGNRKSIVVTTYPKPGETEVDYIKRSQKNFIKAKQIVK